MRIRVALPPWLRAWIVTPPCDLIAPDDEQHDEEDEEHLPRSRALATMHSAGSTALTSGDK